MLQLYVITCKRCSLRYRFYKATRSVGPASGVSQESVEAAFGSPLSKKEPVGDPPISSWEYEGFVVYFEADKVLHTVAKR